ncbi:MAG: PDZ domain-containing protein [Rhodanobacteraceae bacterium]|jgi:hypothetical protein|nr:PDZ domain-containing protein [Rhodanobacteraceae bacterium]
MLKHLLTPLLAAFALAAAAATADEAAALIARDKAASGGARWDAVKTLETSGTLHAGGLDGTFRAVQDLAGARSVTEYRLGPVEGADGYDGTHGWSRDPGGEVATLDAPEAKRRARSQAWLDARGYWYPARLPARYGKVEAREVDGRRYAVVEATPEGGEPLTLWFDAATHRLARVVQAQGQDTATTTFDDWRETDGFTLPFHSVTALTDTAGRTDPRRRTELRIERVTPNVAVADADFAVPEMAATAHIDAAGGVTKIPFELVNNHIYVDGTIDGKPARFLVDTGGVNLLTPTAAKKFGLAAEGKLAARGVGEQEVDLALAHAKEVRVGGAVLAKPVFYVIDLGELPAVEGVEADGLVGYEMFRRFGVTIDYAGHVLTLTEPAKFAPPAGARALPFEQAERIPVVTGTLDGLPIRASIDTGSRASLTLHSPFVREHGLVAKYGADTESVVGWGVGGPNRGRPARFGRLTLGDLAIDGVAGDLYTGDKGSFASPDLSANLGGGVLKRFTVSFDYGKKTMYLAPNAAFGAPDVFDRSGLWLLGAGDALKVADVAAGSAAAKAGLKVDDRLTAIGGEKIATRTLADWRQRLRELPAGTKLVVEYQRAGQPGRAELVLAERIAPRWAGTQK